jgi:DNA repair exonuclease SbcCD nuclease subunit
MSFRFIHTADWQIGKAFGRLPADAALELRTQRIKTVERIAEMAHAKEVHAVLVAGDAFDTNEVADKTLVRTLEALKAFAGPWVFLPGNHDAALSHSVWTRMREIGLPANVVIADTPVAINRWNGEAIVLPAPLRRRREGLDQTEWFDAAPSPEGCRRIGLAHGSIAGRLPGAADAANEIPTDRAERAGLGYLALGDWHGALQIAPRTWYSGTPETDRHRNNDSGHVHLVELDSWRAPERVATVRVGHYCWTKLEVEILDGTCTEVLRALSTIESEHRRCVVVLEIAGAIGLSERRRLDRELKLWEARFHHLEIDDSRLYDDPTVDDLDAVDKSGFVRLAIERLRAKAADPFDPDAAEAKIALRMIYLDHLDKAA